MAFYVHFALLSLCSGQSLTATPSPSPQAPNYLTGPCPYYLNKGILGGTLLYTWPGTSAYAWNVWQCQAACAANITCGAWHLTFTYGCRSYDFATGFPPSVGDRVGVSRGPLCLSSSPTPTSSRSPSLTISPAPSLCPKGSYSILGASNCTLCPVGTYSSTTGSSSCQQCPGGHYCPTGTSSWNLLNCGRGNYCPDGTGAPTPCPYQVPPSGGWGALQAQGPAFLVETARCLTHCFWNFTSSNSTLSKC